MEQSYSDLPNSLVSAANGIDYAYRDTGGHEGAVPLVLLQHFRGNLDGGHVRADGTGRDRGFLFQHHAEFASDVTEFLS